MAFSSAIFLFLFLPIVLAGSFILPGIRLRNAWLLVASLIFYAWGEITFVFLMLGSTLLNYALGLWLDRETCPTRRKRTVGLAVALNLGLLAFFKYANFVGENFNSLLGALKFAPVHFETVRLPIGISFFTFHALSYVIDIYRRKSLAARNPVDVALYIFFFPQLIAGPILRWNAMAPQIARRIVTSDGFFEGIRRFVYGLAKKMLMANTLAVPAGQVFSLSAGARSPALAWFGAICYTLQIYFDFSGYSDMAIGLGKMFGFEFMENFNHPYIAQSIRDFWRRWHISLSSWFRDYLYLTLGGNRRSAARNYFNLLIVFFLCGLWHGASWTFVLWGLYHGFFLLLERTRFGAFAGSIPKMLRHVYTLLVVLLGWVLFRADTLPQALAFLGAMCGFSQAAPTEEAVQMIFTGQAICTVLLGIVFSTPIQPWFKQELLRLFPGRFHPGIQLTGIIAEPMVLTLLLVLSAAGLAGGTYNPFIYFRF